MKTPGHGLHLVFDARKGAVRPVLEGEPSRSVEGEQKPTLPTNGRGVDLHPEGARDRVPVLKAGHVMSGSGLVDERGSVIGHVEAPEPRQRSRVVGRADRSGADPCVAGEIVATHDEIPADRVDGAETKRDEGAELGFDEAGRRHQGLATRLAAEQPDGQGQKARKDAGGR